jgi:sugar (glycoside-pentoside-hexuronide) transporter
LNNENENPSSASVNLSVKLTIKDRLNYSIAEFGYNSIYAWISSFMAIFLTDQIGVAAAAVSFLTLFVRVFDAINDPLIGSMADRSKDRGKGKYKPWVRWGALAMSIFIILLFAMQPGWNMTFKLVYMWIVYIMVTICSTCCNMPFGALNGVITADSEERNKLSGMRMVFANIGTSWNSLIAVPLIVAFSGVGDGTTQTAQGYFFAVLVCVIIGLPTLFWSSYKVKEVVKAPPTQKKIPMKAQFAAFFKNKYAIIMALSFFFIGFCAYGRLTILVYYLTYNCGDAGLMTIASVLGLISAIVGSGFLGIWMYKKLKNKGLTLGLAYGIAGVFAIIGYFMPDGSVSWFVMYGLSVLFQTTGIGVAYGMVGDSVDYGEYVSGVRVDGFISSFVSLMMKAGGAVGPAILVAWMGAAGYVANAVQTSEVLFVFRFGINVIVGICCIILFVLGLFFDLTPEKHEKVRKELERRRMQ